MFSRAVMGLPQFGQRERGEITGSLRLVRFVLFGDTAYGAFTRAAEEMVGPA